MKLYYNPLSSNARRARVAAHILGTEIELEIVDFSKGQHKSPEYLKLNPNGAVPTLVDGDFVLWESVAIMQYLADKKPGNTLYPTDPQVRADVNRWLCWGLAHWGPSISIIVMENLLKKMMGLGEPDPAQVQRGEASFDRYGKVLDEHLAKRDHLVAKGLTLADIALGTSLMYAQAAKVPVDKFHNIQRWFGRIQDLEAWKKTTPPT